MPSRRPLILYAESSAVLAWLVGEDAGRRVRDVIAGADLVITSDLTRFPASLPDLVLLSVDPRLRAAGQLLGLRLMPE